MVARASEVLLKVVVGHLSGFVETNSIHPKDQHCFPHHKSTVHMLLGMSRLHYLGQKRGIVFVSVHRLAECVRICRPEAGVGRSRLFRVTRQDDRRYTAIPRWHAHMRAVGLRWVFQPV